MSTHHPHARRRRARGALAIVVLLVGGLGGAFFRVQVLASSEYELKAESNRLRPLDIPAPRGTVFDRDGRVIADNVPAYGISILPLSPDSMATILDRLARYVELDEERKTELLGRLRSRPRQPLVVARDVPFSEVSALEERRAEFPNVHIETRPKRRYPSGPPVAHVIGTLGEIDAEELASDRFDAERYEQGMVVGKTGIERQYERRLQGRSGVRYVEVDASGRIVGDFGGSEVLPAVPGQNVRLAIDLDLQEWIHRIVPKDKSGAVVALDPADGSVLALYSWPTFDPDAFVGGITSAEWSELNADTLNPLLNRAIQSPFPPASTFKPLVAAIGLELGVVTASEVMPVACTGGMFYGGEYRRCWKEEGHGYLDLAGAIQHSCDVYFYQLGLEIGLDRLLHEGVELGLRDGCGIDLPGEESGRFPRDRGFWREVYGYRAQEGEVLSLAIGQGPNSQSSLRVAQAYVALARDGSAPAPSVILDREERPEGWDMDISAEHLDVIRQGLRAVTAPGGTAHLTATVEHWDIIGKTGTGENYRSGQGIGETDAWFAGIAGPPGEDPEIVVVVVVEGGGGGSAVAAPLMAKTADFYLRRKYGIPVDTVQTLQEHILRGGWPEWAPPPEAEGG